MRKYIKIVVYVSLLLFTVMATFKGFMVYSFVDEVKVLDGECVHEYYNYYGISEDEIVNKRIKEVFVKVKVFNGRPNSLKNINIKLENTSNDILLTNKTDTRLPWNINIKPLTKKNIGFYFLVDCTDISDEEIIDKLKETTIYVESLENGNKYLLSTVQIGTDRK